MDMVYVKTAGARITADDAPTIGAELARIGQEGHLTPVRVVAEARDPRSPLHSFFEWDDTDAAHQYRLSQARELIRSVRVVIQNDERETASVRAFLHVMTDEPRYVATMQVMGDAEMRAEVLEKALAELRSWERRYRHLAEFAGVVDAIAQVRKAVGA